jgi:hypothetical protein
MPSQSKRTPRICSIRSSQRKGGIHWKWLANGSSDEHRHTDRYLHATGPEYDPRDRHPPIQPVDPKLEDAAFGITEHDKGLQKLTAHRPPLLHNLSFCESRRVAEHTMPNAAPCPQAGVGCPLATPAAHPIQSSDAVGLRWGDLVAYHHGGIPCGRTAPQGTAGSPDKGLDIDRLRGSQQS